MGAPAWTPTHPDRDTRAVRARDHSYFDAPFVALAHRGGSLLEGNVGRENTVHAFRAAQALGFDHGETDVHATADGVLIAFHDDRLDRVTDDTGLVAGLPWDRVREARVGGEPIPTLDELLETFPTMCFNVDIKAPGAIEPLVRTINAHRAHDRVCVGSFSVQRIEAFRRLMGRQVPTAASVAGTVWTAFVPLLPRLLPSTAAVFQLPTHQTVRGVRIPVVTRRLVDNAHAAGRDVHVWTIDDAAEMVRLIDLGVDGIVTDRPDVLKDVLLSRDLWRDPS